MTLDLEQVLSGVLEWDFSLTHNGKTTATRPLSIGDIGRIMAMAVAAKKRQAAIAANPDAPPPETATENPYTMLLGFLAEQGPHVEAWVSGFRLEMVSAALIAINQYAQETMRKNSPAIAPAIKAAMAIPTSSAVSGNSTQP